MSAVDSTAWLGDQLRWFDGPRQPAASSTSAQTIQHARPARKTGHENAQPTALDRSRGSINRAPVRFQKCNWDNAWPAWGYSNSTSDTRASWAEAAARSG